MTFRPFLESTADAVFVVATVAAVVVFGVELEAEAPVSQSHVYQPSILSSIRPSVHQWLDLE